MGVLNVALGASQGFNNLATEIHKGPMEGRAQRGAPVPPRSAAPNHASSQAEERLRRTTSCNGCWGSLNSCPYPPN